MDEDRLKLHFNIEELLPGYTLYFRPDSKLVLQYPCVVYDVKQFRANHAQNKVYTVGTLFKVTIMTNLPGTKEPEKLLDLPNSSHVTTFISNDIVHDEFQVHVK